MRTVFTNDSDVEVNVIDHRFSETFSQRDNHEVMFRRINTFLLEQRVIDGNIIDLGSWIGDNSIPWALNSEHTIYAIDPSPENIEYIEKMQLANGIANIRTIQTAVGDKNEIICTDNDLDHCQFNKTSGKNRVQCLTLDHLYEQKQIADISYIHLDVEGFEFNVVRGADSVINTFRPIISYEQHLDREDYKELSAHLFNRGYNIYLVNEILPGCYYDCRNLFAVPAGIELDVDELHESIGSPVLLSVFNHATSPRSSICVGRLFGTYFDNMEFHVKAVLYQGLYIFCVNQNNYAKLVATDTNGDWICSKNLLGHVDTNCEKTIINAYLSAQNEVEQSQYNVEIL